MSKYNCSPHSHPFLYYVFTVTTGILFWADLCLTHDKTIYLGSPTGNRCDMVTHSFSSLSQTLRKCSVTGKFRKIYEQCLNLHIYTEIPVQRPWVFQQSTKIHKKFSLKFLVIIAVMTQLVKNKNLQCTTRVQQIQQSPGPWQKMKAPTCQSYEKLYVDDTQFRHPFLCTNW